MIYFLRAAEHASKLSWTTLRCIALVAMGTKDPSPCATWVGEETRVGVEQEESRPYTKEERGWGMWVEKEQGGQRGRRRNRKKE